MGRQPSKESKQRWLEANRHKRPSINKDCRLRTFYGISPEEFQHMLEAQNGKCAICKTSFSNEDKKHMPHVDHDHNSGWVRGLTCQSCNFGIGSFEDDINRLESAIEYLISNSTPPEFNIGAARERLKVQPKDRKRLYTPHRPEQREKLRQAQLRNWADPEFRKRAIHARWGKNGTK